MIRICRPAYMERDIRYACECTYREGPKDRKGKDRGQGWRQDDKARVKLYGGGSGRRALRPWERIWIPVVNSLITILISVSALHVHTHVVACVCRRRLNKESRYTKKMMWNRRKCVGNWGIYRRYEKKIKEKVEQGSWLL